MTQLIIEKNFKELEIILSSFACDKNCPYCTAKITQWDKVEDDIYTLGMYTGQMKKLGYTFHYVTIGGNGEPTLHSYQKLKDIVEMFDDWDIPVKRVLTSGNIFRPEEKDKYDLFVSHNWMFEVTTTSFDNGLDRETQGYDFNYFETDAFKNARIRLNYALLKRNRDKYISEIQEFAKKYPNIETLALKLLNINTKTGLVDNNFSAWIVENALSKDLRETIASELNKAFKYKGEAFDTHSWEMDDGREIYFSWKKVEYGLYDLVYYGNRFINYQCEKVGLAYTVPKIYLASRFITDKKDGKLSLKRDFRSVLIGGEDKLIDANYSSFITNDTGKTIFQYIGPFYNEKASCGELTSTDCMEVVRTENKLIEKCDIFIIYLDEEVSPGSLTELVYAATLGKQIVVIFKKEDDIKYSLKSSNWYPITFAKLLQECTRVYTVRFKDEVLRIIRELGSDDSL